MDLLLQLQRQPVDPDYARVAAEPGRRPRMRWAVLLVALLAGVLIAVSALQTSRRAPVLASERQELIARIQAAEQQQDDHRRQVTDLTAEIDRLRTAAIGSDEDTLLRQIRINALEPSVGTVAVTGPGVVITVDDAPGSEGERRDQVLDLDLQLLTNGLWESGAEAVAINGHRLSALTAIRGAGEAITVDYRSLTRPYVVSAIGDARTLPARFAESGGGRWWQDLARNRQMPFTVTTTQQLTLAPDPGMVLRYAQRGRG